MALVSKVWHCRQSSFQCRKFCIGEFISSVNKNGKFVVIFGAKHITQGQDSFTYSLFGKGSQRTLSRDYSISRLSTLYTKRASICAIHICYLHSTQSRYSFIFASIFCLYLKRNIFLENQLTRQGSTNFQGFSNMGGINILYK